MYEKIGKFITKGSFSSSTVAIKVEQEKKKIQVN